MDNLLAWLLGLRNAVWQTLLSLFPFFTDAQRLQRLGRGLVTFLHVLALIAVLAFLFWLNKALELEVFLRSKQSVAWLRPYWLPLLFLLLYTICWLGWLIYKLIAGGDEASTFPRLDAAWDEISAALRHAGLGWSDAPVFLVLGQTRAGETALFQAASYSFLVKAPIWKVGDPEPPIRLYANREVMFLTVRDASLLGSFAAFLSEPADTDAVEQTINLYGTIAAGKGAASGEANEAVHILQGAMQVGRSVRQLTEEEQDELRRLARKPRTSFLRQRNEVSRASARLRHVCHRLHQERHPYCPLNGILLLLPWYAMDSDEEASDASQVCRRDLDSVRRALHLDCPVFVLCCDLEETPGMEELLDSMPADIKERGRLGFRFPLVPDTDLKGTQQSLAEAVRWICHTWFPLRVIKSFGVESQDASMSGVVRRNYRLFRLLYQTHRHRRKLRRIVSGIAAPDKGDPALLGGCYLAATGVMERSQAFSAGVFRRLAEEQDHVVWTEKAFEDEKWYWKWTQMGYAACIFLWIVFAGGIVWTLSVWNDK